MTTERSHENYSWNSFGEHYLLEKVMNDSKKARGERAKAYPSSVFLLYYQKELRPDQNDAAEPVHVRAFPLSLVMYLSLSYGRPISL